MDLTLWHRLPLALQPKPGRTYPLCTMSGGWVRNTVGTFQPANPAQPVLR
jgi:hypothetical protein